MCDMETTTKEQTMTLKVKDQVESISEPTVAGRIVRINRRSNEAEIHLADTDPVIIRTRSLNDLRKSISVDNRNLSQAW